jgi:hypothetical protein
MTGMSTPRHVLSGDVFLQPQSAVLTKYTPGVRGAPTGAPTVSPGWVTDPARAAEAVVQTNSAHAAANFVTLHVICFTPNAEEGSQPFAEILLALPPMS